MQKALVVVVVVFCLPLVMIFTMAVFTATPSCGAGPRTLSGSVPEQVGVWTGEQIRNAAAIIGAARVVPGVTARDQAIAVMVAMRESSLINIDYGDWETSGVRNPDGTPTSSIGLFQQQHWWGSVEERMNPRTASILFYRALVKVSNREHMTPTMVGHQVQNNANPDHYTPAWNDARMILEALTTQGCSMDADIWQVPVKHADGTLFPITSPYGWRFHPIRHQLIHHDGVDLGAPCGHPTYPINSGTVETIVADRIWIDHGNGIKSGYYHIYPNDFKVSVGDTVTHDTVIALVGNAGLSAGCHVHLQISVNGTMVDPQDFLAERGAPLT
ncbi:MAG: M23 family metallopeptidase [Propionibacteriaceae bacterium]|jgi:murein DD-endopeptidase MepM/ murein hydrolase activator NlpD|nr:M23 family metallopeptidase [Propionibacteriaceae bacterium]